MSRLYRRARQMRFAATGLVLMVPANGWITDWSSRHGPWAGSSGGERWPEVTMAALVAAVLVSFTLAGADVELERSTPRLTAWWQGRHAVLAVAAASGPAVAAVALTGLDGHGLARTTLGLTGIVLLGSTVLPAAVCWAPAFGYALTVNATPVNRWAGSDWWGWVVQAGPSRPAWTMALALAFLGIVGYAIRGPVGGDVRRG